jgi:signal transduction histidine kinase
MPRWFRSFYFRIAFSFVLFAICLVVVQGLIFRFAAARSPLRDRSPNTVVAIVAADLGAALQQNRARDVDAYLKEEYAQAQPIYLVMRTGIASNRTAPLAADLRRYVETMLAGGGRPDVEPQVSVPFVTAPVLLDETLFGIVVLPPAPRRFSADFSRQVEWLASVPGTALLVALAVVAALVIFEPARRRLNALERATGRLGHGDLTARADDGGGDEIARVAASFNAMAGELAHRDQALRASDDLRRQLLADVSHELKTPLTAMRGYVETLRRADIELDEHTRERYFATLERETLRLDRIVKDLLDLARLENGVAELETRVFATGRLFDHVVQRHQQEIQRRGTVVRVEVASQADQMFADPDRIEQVIENLFANALRHTANAGAIELAAWVDDGILMLSVSDWGEGIAAEHIENIFERFYRVDAARGSAAGGSGLGLSIAKAIVERHHGTIRVESRPGRTIFTVALPKGGALVHAESSTSANL